MTNQYPRPAGFFSPFSVANRRPAPRLNTVLLACVVAFSSMAVSISAQAQATGGAAALSLQRQINLPTQPLGATLNALAREWGVAISVDAAQAMGKTAPAQQGTTTLGEALTKALAGSGLAAVPTGSAITVQPRAAEGAVLAAVTVTAQADRSGTTEGTGSYAATGPSTTATGLPLTLRETPQSVSVVTQQQIQDQNMQTLDDVADAATGITYSKLGTERSYFYSRGFAITDLQVDGMSTSVAESYSADAMSLNNMAIYDRVEIVRGANGLLQGSGNPSAVINMVRKRPTREFQFSGELSAGSWANYSTQLDVSGPLNNAGTLRGRAVVYANDANSFKTGAGTNNTLFYAIGEADLTASTMLTLGASVQKDDHKGYDWGGLNTKADGSFYDLPRSASLAGPWAHLNRDNATAFGDVTHRFDNNWTLTAAVNAVYSEASFLGSYPARVSGDTYRLVVADAEYTDKQLALNLKASGPFSLFGRQHELMVAASSREDEFSYPVYTANNTPTVNITDFDFWSIPAPNLNWAAGSNNRLKRTEKGFVLATRLHATDDLSVILGSRLSWSDYASKSAYVDATYDSGRQFIPYAGVVYNLSGQHALYASYTDIYSIQQYYGPSGLLAPVEGKNYEAGIKSTFFGGQLNTAVAAFQTDQVNLPVALTIAPSCGLSGAARCYSEGGKVRNRGFELEVSGAPMKGWNMAAGFTFSDPEYVAGPNTGKDYNGDVPRKVLKVSTDYQLPGGQWRVGGNIQSQSGMYYDGTTYRVEQGGYTLLNLQASFRYDKHFKVQLNVHNALDKSYYQTIPKSNNYGGLYVGAPRSATVTLRYDY
jgi:outer membrane receptor for ferric coprogen and ferric-rhodotorulic acid